MTFQFKGKRVVVTGGSRGIGRAIALGFAGAGADVSICARGRDALDATRTELEAKGRAHAAVCDLADGEAVKRYVADAATALGGIDVLVNNASGFGMGDDEAGWAAGLAVDVMAMVRASHVALPLLEQAPGSSIINISSISGLRPSVRAAAYGAVKAAMMHYTTSQAATLARKGIRVNCIAPPYSAAARDRPDVPHSVIFGRLPLPNANNACPSIPIPCPSAFDGWRLPPITAPCGWSRNAPIPSACGRTAPSRCAPRSTRGRWSPWSWRRHRLCRHQRPDRQRPAPGRSPAPATGRSWRAGAACSRAVRADCRARPVAIPRTRPSGSTC
jgi:3-oxoacyl-[acyl-carrier protein] reductase